MRKIGLVFAPSIRRTGGSVGVGLANLVSVLLRAQKTATIEARFGRDLGNRDQNKKKEGATIGSGVSSSSTRFRNS